MKKHTEGISVGLFLLAGLLALLFLGLKVSGSSNSNTAGTYRLYANFESIAGLTVNAKVTMAGVVIGRVTAIDLDRDDFSARVTMQMNKDMDDLPNDSKASILTEGLMGRKYIGVSMGADKSLLSADSTIHDTQSSLVLEDVIGKFLFNTVNNDAK
ncbi:outer membrane lipid asymmetry maintenance protein MlaD [Pseudomonas fluorescens]|uniref:Outer membrane lipid asymmetry maintenance protein MlaD n=1 Tax=Pseudomonas fluorescens TaxID=294 RepID=A0A1T2Z8G5_PSEFL|nr:outer membrane lipid asymmetry maintenance protein MlaD [Pseudomonas fluorescens]OPB00931.1 outer membrane lipid asymmetry maintenance protein MlaD [Pseudomonas fluorescens]